MEARERRTTSIEEAPRAALYPEDLTLQHMPHSNVPAPQIMAELRVDAICEFHNPVYHFLNAARQNRYCEPSVHEAARIHRIYNKSLHLRRQKEDLTSSTHQDVT